MTERPISVCALVPYPPNTAPSQRFRIEQWLPTLRDRGIGVELLPFADVAMLRVLHQRGQRVSKALATVAAFARRLSHLAAVGRHDVVLIHRAACIVGPALFERVLPLFRLPVIFDFDDAIYLPHSTEANRRLGWLKFPGKTAALCRLSARIVVGNSGLADYARQFHRQVTVIPSSVDVERYDHASRNGAGGRVVVGWTGSSTSQTYLEMFAPVLRELLARRNVELRVHSDREPVLPGMDFVWRPWRPETEVEEVAAFDIGIMPLPDDSWTRGKCAMKALIYMASGIPTICSAVGTNLEVIRHGENGLLARTPAEWLTCLETLIDNPSLRMRLGSAGRRTVAESYSMTRCADQFAQVVFDVMESKKVHSGI